MANNNKTTEVFEICSVKTGRSPLDCMSDHPACKATKRCQDTMGGCRKWFCDPCWELNLHEDGDDQLCPYRLNPSNRAVLQLLKKRYPEQAKKIVEQQDCNEEEQLTVLRNFEQQRRKDLNIERGQYKRVQHKL